MNSSERLVVMSQLTKQAGPGDRALKFLLSQEVEKQSPLLSVATKLVHRPGSKLRGYSPLFNRRPTSAALEMSKAMGVPEDLASRQLQRNWTYERGQLADLIRYLRRAIRGK